MIDAGRGVRICRVLTGAVQQGSFSLLQAALGNAPTQLIRKPIFEFRGNVLNRLFVGVVLLAPPVPEGQWLCKVRAAHPPAALFFWGRNYASFIWPCLLWRRTAELGRRDIR